MNALPAWGRALLTPEAAIEAAVLLACLLAAGLLLHLLRTPGTRRLAEHAPFAAHPIWFGRRTVDGVLFPLLALLLAWGARAALRPQLPLTVFKIVLPVLLSLAAIRLASSVLRLTFPSAAWARHFERSVSWLAWLAVVGSITGALPLLLRELDGIVWKFGSTEVSLRNLLEGVVTAAVVLIGALWLSAALEARLLKGAVDNLSGRKMAANGMRALLLFVGLILALEAAGIDLTALGVLGGALGVGIGLGLQKLAANYVSGFVILAERSMRIGDTVKVDQFEGRITDITMRYTVIRALNGREAIVPNEMLVTQRVENSSLADPRVLLTTTLVLPHGCPVESLIERLAGVVAGVPRVLVEPPPLVQLSAFSADGLELTVAFWIGDPENGSGQVRSLVNRALLAELNALGIALSSPARLVLALPAAVVP